MWCLSPLLEIFGNSNDITRYRDELLATLSSDVREDYGDPYVSSLPSSLTRMSQQSAADLSPVVDDMCHALLSLHPAPVYSPGQMAWLLPFLHRCCPTGVFDLIIMKILKVSDHKPAGIDKTWGLWEILPLNTQLIWFPYMLTTKLNRL